MKWIQGTSFSKLLFAFLRSENENTSKIFFKKYYLEVVKGKITFYVVKQILVSLFNKCFLCMPEEQQIQCLIQILNMTWAEACGHLKGAKLCLGGSWTSGCCRLMCQRRKALWWHLACSCFFFLSQSELIFLFTLCFPKCWSLTVRKCIFNFLEWPSIPQDFSLCVADWAKRKIKCI